MRWLALFIALCAAATLPQRGAAETVVAGLSKARVAITTGFHGSEILVFGAVKRAAPPPADPPLEVIITVTGPPEHVTVRRKSREVGIWINTASADIAPVPSFYAISTTGPLAEVLSPEEDRANAISIPRQVTGAGIAIEGGARADFAAALIRIRQESGLYALHEGAVSLSQDTLFRGAIDLPANLTEGDYQVRIFLTRGGAVIDSYATTIDVSMVGLERWTYNLAQKQPLIYGLLSIFIAIAAGWGASAVFRYIRGS